MAAQKRDEGPKKDPLAAEIDALLKKLPHADPEPEPPRKVPPPASPPSVRAAPLSPPARSPEGKGQAPIAVWARVVGAVLLGGAFTQWPYAADCGWGLLAYGSALAALLIVGGWCAMEAWRAHLGAAHAVSLIVVFWGVALAAELLLPRIGYAAEAATWRCVADAPVVTPSAPRLERAAPPPDAVLPDAASPARLPADSPMAEAETRPDSVQD